RLLLQSACLAGVLRAPLVIDGGGTTEAAELRRRLRGWGTAGVFAAGAAARLCRGLHGVRGVRLAHAEARAPAPRRRLREQGPVNALVVANSADCDRGAAPLSALAPWVALQRRAALVLTDDAGANTAAAVRAALRRPGLGRADVLILVGDLRAVPME